MASQPSQGDKRLCEAVLNTLLAGAAGGGIGCLFVLATVLFYELSGTGSAADWIASIANAAMAVTAILAFNAARSWLPQLKIQEGYKEAISLVNEQYIQLGADNPLTQSVEAVIQTFQVQNNDNTTATLTAHIEALNDLAVHLQAASATLQEIRQTQFRLNTYGLTIHRHYAASVANMITAFEHALQSAWWLCELLTKDASLHCQAHTPPPRYNSLNWPAITLGIKKAETAANIEAQHQNVKQYLDAMMTAHDAVFSQHPSVGHLFHYKK
ncbi:hypothetical protein J4I24_004278 [Salmonella enterica]|uniref:Uncharacterized protein n=1 Tax=Salmonella montevideo TaxID=115981 RepID=A0A741Q196_SALMO|nr:hypothetical protein [Salmonella enterica]EHK3167081.1 hypothetical protein [Salmonella enterica subsp. enterica serovar Urbana]HAF0924300.1 hypothetical protein [Salmonella enterica subsp. enterica serovar Montevideo]ECW3621162.1 hypothetical protein [Salmonella enterica]EEO8459251.1 hypothetical protein [Salmonella enterica]EGL6551248.1 hypothetical protein [Salmonella enterica]